MDADQIIIELEKFTEDESRALVIDMHAKIVKAT
jgi:hypothetical protein